MVAYFKHKFLNIYIKLQNNVEYINDDLLFLFLYSFDSMYNGEIITDYMNIELINNEFCFTWNDSTYSCIKSREELFWIINEVVYGEIFTQNENWILLHSAAIKYKDKIIIFMANSNHGKSTFVYETIISSDSEYITDDFLPINNGTLYACNFFKPISIRESNPNFMSIFRNCYNRTICIKYNGEKKKLIFPINKASSVNMKNSLIIVFLNRNKEYNTPLIEVIDKNQALIQLLQNFLKTGVRQKLQFAVKFLQEYPICRCNYSGVEHINMKELLDSIIKIQD